MEDEQALELAAAKIRKKWAIDSAQYYLNSSKARQYKQQLLMYSGAQEFLPDFVKSPKFSIVPSQYNWPNLMRMHLSKPTKNELELI